MLNIIRTLDQKSQNEIHKLKRELERQLTGTSILNSTHSIAVDDNLNALIKKLSKREDTSEGRINELEARMNQKIDNKLDSELEDRYEISPFSLIGLVLRRSNCTLRPMLARK